DGVELWRYVHGVPFETGASIATLELPGAGPTEVAMVGSRDGQLLALDLATGAPRWRTLIEGDMRAPPTLVGDRLVVTSSANKVTVLEAGTGKAVWSHGRPPPSGLTVEGHARATVHGDKVFATFSDGYVVAFALTHGTVLWSRPLSLRGGGFVDADADPIVDNGQLFVASYSDGVYALAPEDGQTLWNRFAPAVTSLALHGGRVLVGSADGYVWGLSRDDGALAFRTKLAVGPVSRLLVDRGLVALTGGINGLVVLDARTGKPLQATSFGGRAASDPVWVDDELAFLSSSGYLYAWRLVGPPAAQG
ncbi:MAG TPA: PQQ-binding-like beta-propeller repeat protein, partial [Myxococcota bacterium]|nr:PQQ-binding-like beta-propeller repeat protein [Myxococcota bacterium]